MPCDPHTPADRERMLAAIGIESVDDLFALLAQTLGGGFQRRRQGDNAVAGLQRRLVIAGQAAAKPLRS